MLKIYCALSAECTPDRASAKCSRELCVGLLPTGAYISMTPWPNSLKVSFQPVLRHTESNKTLTSNQLGTKPCTQTHDAIYSLIATIQYNKYTLQNPTYVVFVDYSTAYPSVHRDRLSSILLHNGIVGNMWHHLRARINNIRLRILHPHIQEHQTVDILRGLPEGKIGRASCRERV